MPAIPFHAYRSPVYSRAGVVATSQPSAVLAGVNILQSGGNAADAAIAAAAVLAVTEPVSCGLGGDMFALYRRADTGEILALNGSGRAPAGLSLDYLQARGIGELKPFSALTVTVPGAAAGWCDLHRRLATKPLTELLAPAIAVAEEGFPVAPKTAFAWAFASKYQLATHGQALLIDGRAPAPGEIFRNPDLARTLQLVAENGPDAFYRGPIADTIVAAVRDAGGVLALADLDGHRSTWEQPISTDAFALEVHECPPNGQGLTALLALAILRELAAAGDLGGPGSITRAHLTIEALRLAFADARRYIADPAFADIPVAHLLDPAYARARAALIDRQRATIDPAAGSPDTGSDTVYLAVVDGQGNACSFIQSNYMGVGTGIVPAGTGSPLQNRGHNFVLEPGHKNCLMPGKRPFHTIIPGLITDLDNTALRAAFGVMGGFMQPQGHVQVILAMALDGADPQQALDRPRLCLEQSGVVALEDGVPDSVADGLAERGHRVRRVTGHLRSLFGRGQIIARDPHTGVLCGGSDLRGDGLALGC